MDEAIGESGLMREMPLHILLVEDNPAEARLLRETLAEIGTGHCEVHDAGCLGDALRRLTQEQHFDVILLDLSLPDSGGVETVSRMRAAAPRLAIVVLTGLDDETLGLEAIRAGAQDYLVKGQTDARLLTRAIRYATERKRVEEELRELNRTLEQRVADRTALLKLMHDVTAAANKADTVEQAMGLALGLVCELSDWCFGHAYLPSADDPDELVPARDCYYHLADRFGPFRVVTQNTRWRRGQGLPGRVFATGRPEWTADIRSSLLPSRAQVAESLGIKAAVAFPILVGTEVAAVMEFFCDRPVKQDKRILEALTAIGTQLGRVVERQRWEKRLADAMWAKHRQVGQDLHDGPMQHLAGLGMLAAGLYKKLRASSSPHADAAGEFAKIIRNAQDQLRAMIDGLPPVDIEASRFLTALDKLLAATEKLHHIRCTLECDRSRSVTGNQTATQLFHIAQEAVTNVVRHARAKHITVTLSVDGPHGTLQVRDDGVGLPGDASPATGMGLRIMQYRAGIIGAALEIRPAEGGGTVITCTFQQEVLDGHDSRCQNDQTVSR